MEVVVLATRDSYRHQELVQAFVERIDIPVRVVDLDDARDPAETVRRKRVDKPNPILGAGTSAAHLVRRDVKDFPAVLTLVHETGQQLKSTSLCFVSHHPEARDIMERVLAVLPGAGLAASAWRLPPATIAATSTGVSRSCPAGSTSWWCRPIL